MFLDATLQRQTVTVYTDTFKSNIYILFLKFIYMSLITLTIIIIIIIIIIIEK